MVDIGELILIGLSALAGSAFMWLVLGPIVIRRSAPKLVRGIMQDVAALTDKEIAEADGDFFRAMTHKQGATFADAINGALGNLMQSKPTAELETLAKQYGFAGVEDAKEKILGGTSNFGSDVGGGVGNPAAILGGLQQLQGLGGGGKNKFSGLVETLALVQAFGALGGGGNGTMPAMPSGGRSRSTSVW